MASQKVREIIEQVINTYQEEFGDLYPEEYVLEDFASKCFMWLEEDLQKHYKPPKYITDKELVKFLELYFKKDDLHKDASIAGEKELLELILMGLIVEIGHKPNLTGFQLTALAKYLKKHNLLF